MAVRFVKGHWLILIALLALFGCKNRSAEIVGTWAWNQEQVTFLDDGTWKAFANDRPNMPSRSGYWSATGPAFTLKFDSTETTKPDDKVFFLSQDGKRLEGDKPSDGVMTKQLEANPAAPSP
jgi:hypothetical protein